VDEARTRRARRFGDDARRRHVRRDVLIVASGCHHAGEVNYDLAAAKRLDQVRPVERTADGANVVSTRRQMRCEVAADEPRCAGDRDGWHATIVARAFQASVF